ncbi:MAG: S8 family serine peptidase [Bacteroidia bacterium]|nr:S8 family serine peptidase [Bacteroidia bacterium]
MKRFFSLALLLTLAFGAVVAQQMDWNKIDPLLEHQLRENPNAHIKVTLHLTDQVDLEGMLANFNLRGTDIHSRRVAVVTALKQKAQATQAPLLSALASHPGVLNQTIKSYWLSNDIRAEMRYDAIAAMSQYAEIGLLLFEPPTKLDDADAAGSAPYLPAPETAGGREIGLDVINAPALWAMGYTGIGKKILIIDSGVSLTHPAHQRNYYGNVVGNSLAWYNPGGPKEPFDCDEHGTHVAGVAVGMQLSNRDTFGVAFNAQWMGSPAVDGGTAAGTCLFDVDDLDALQWALDPDDNPATTNDMPDVINGSYGTDPQFFGLGICTGSTFKQRMDALEAASVTFIQSAGNYGPGDSTLGVYKNINTTIVNSFVVGSVNGYNANLPISGFSSRGPSRCGNTGSLRFKPEVVAPGNNVRSSVPGGGFKLLAGTSFSSPHTAGAALLIHEAFPTATSTDVKEALYFSAVDLGTPGEDNAYGKGIIDLLAAYNYLVGLGFTPATVSRDKDAVLAEVFVDNLVCGEDITPTFVLENNGKTTMTTAEVTYTYSNGTTGTYTWNGSLAPGATEIVTLPTQVLPIGNYDLDLLITSVDGQADYYNLDNNGSGSFSILGDDTPVVTNTLVNPAAVCSGAQALLTATTATPGRTPAWYADPNGTTLLATGNTFLTPVITGSKFYYVGTVGQTHIGMPNKDVGSNFPSFNVNSYLEFEVYGSVTLKSVLINASSTEQRLIQLRNEAGTVIASKPTGSLKVGDNRITLDFSLSPGTYKLGLGGSASGLSATIANIAFPYEVPGIISITGSDNGFYSFFYDWEVEYKGVCALVQAAVSVAPGAASASFTADKTVVDLGTSGAVTFTNVSTGAATYAWDFGDGSTSTDANPVHTYTFPGTYLVTLSAKASGGCADGDTLSIQVDGFPTSLEDLQAEYGKIGVYPNPSNGLFVLDLELKRPIAVEVEVVDLVGKTVWTQEARTFQQAKANIDLSSLSDGVYLLRVTLDGITLTEKLIKNQ